MINIYIVLLFGILMGGCTGSAQEYNANKLIGTWISSGEIEYIFIFKEASKIELMIKEKGEIIKAKGIYKVDFDKRPSPLSITKLNNIGTPIHTIVRLIGNDTLVMGGFSPKWRLRPIIFKKNETLILKRL